MPDTNPKNFKLMGKNGVVPPEAEELYKVLWNLVGQTILSKGRNQSGFVCLVCEKVSEKGDEHEIECEVAEAQAVLNKYRRGFTNEIVEGPGGLKSGDLVEIRGSITEEDGTTEYGSWTTTKVGLVVDWGFVTTTGPARTWDAEGTTWRRVPKDSPTNPNT